MIRSERRVAQGEKGDVYHLAGVDGVLHTVADVEDLGLDAVLAVLAEFFFFEHIEVCSGIRVKSQDTTPLPGWCHLFSNPHGVAVP